jgi:hypothetical protein
MLTLPSQVFDASMYLNRVLILGDFLAGERRQRSRLFVLVHLLHQRCIDSRSHDHPGRDACPTGPRRIASDTSLGEILADFGR